VNQQQKRSFNGLLSRTTRVSQYQKGKTNLDLLEQEMMSGSDISWATYANLHLAQTDNHASNQPLSFFTVRMPFPLHE